MKAVFDNYDFRAILAMDNEGCIGKGNELPWEHEPADMKNFKELTTGHAVLMGKKTWDSLPEQYRPLPNRQNIVLTSDPKSVIGLGRDDVAIPSLEMLKHYVASGTRLFLIGGATMYDQFVEYAKVIHLTEFDYTFEGDVFLSDKVMNEIGARAAIVGKSSYHVSKHGYSFDMFGLVE